MSYRCSLPSPLQKRSKDYKGLHRSSARFELLSFLWLWQDESWETQCPHSKPVTLITLHLSFQLGSVPTVSHMTPQTLKSKSYCHSTPLPLAEVSIPILQEGIPTIQVASAPALLGLIMPQSDKLNNNKVPVSSPNLPAPVRKRRRPADSEAMKAQIRDEQRKKQQRRSKDWRSEEEEERSLRELKKHVTLARRSQLSSCQSQRKLRSSKLAKLLCNPL